MNRIGKYTAGRIMANASGKAASSATPPSTSQVSLPSQIGATEFIIRSRLASSGANGDRIPTPKSKPSSSTYMNTPSARMPAHKGTRSSAMAVLFSFYRGERSRRRTVRFLLDGRRHAGLEQANHEVSPRAEDHRVSNNIDQKRGEHVRPGERRRHRITCAQQPVYDPRLAPHFGGDPARNHGNETRRGGNQAQAMKPCHLAQNPASP